MSDEELDDLFRKSAERYDPPFDPEAWRAMDRKLDGRHGGWSGVRRFLPLLLALLGSMVLIWQLADSPATSTAETPKTENLAAAQATEAAGTQQQARARNGEAAILPEPPVVESQRQEKHTGPGIGVSVEGDHKTPAKRDVVPVKPLKLISIALKKSTASIATAMEAADITVVNPQTLLPDSATQASPEQAAQTEIAGSSDPRQDQKEPVFLKNISLALVLAPDITSVRFRNADAVSMNAGIMVSVPLTERLSLVTGAVGAKKIYRTEASEYEPYPGFWDNRPLPDGIEAKCQVLDIPLNLQYHFLKRGKNILSVQAGVSSYLMLEEKYTYTYQHAGQKPYSKIWEVSNENKHWFGVQNLSIGYTRRLSPALFVGAEPFVKIPLSDIGAGRLKLTSAGVFFMAGYTLNR
ncbi:hypothetical protein [Pontibacter flavimaris]|uniref:Outer membrane protein beta-barrel domain-containing protein n=1 Tax=Pontibacter flavimaris TaxID=1797110 RepID=A0A1Q5P8W4_9BACT|nr:hypothetical protein [Pontibacter flavimaris]OKL38621.1 hypothetical protein A3841_05600 [Pontibacter flavimaris]